MRPTADALADAHHQVVADTKRRALAEKAGEPHPDGEHYDIGRNLLVAIRDNGEVVVEATALKGLWDRAEEAGLLDDEDGALIRTRISGAFSRKLV